MLSQYSTLNSFFELSNIKEHIDNPEGVTPLQTQDQYKDEQVQDIIKNLQKFSDDAKSKLRPNDEEIVLFRFYNGNSDGLQSLATKEQLEELKNLPEEELQKFYTKHMSNEKTLESGGKIYNSPLLSTTQDLPSFVNTSFGFRGDVNLRQDVFNKALKLAAFKVPKKACVFPQKKYHS